MSRTQPSAARIRAVGWVLLVAGALASCLVFGSAAIAAMGLVCTASCPTGPPLWPALLILAPLLLLVLTLLVHRGVPWAALLLVAIGIVLSVAGGILATWPLAVVGLPLMLGATIVVSPLRHERR